MFFAAIVTQLLARFTKVLDSRHKVPMTTSTYMSVISNEYSQPIC